MKRAFLFPGQGSQAIGMGKEIYENYEVARKIYDKACEISGIDVKRICFEGPVDILNKTEYTQIAIMTTSLALVEVLKEKDINANICVGLSLGEYAALVYAGFLSFEQGIKLIKTRGYLMGNMLPNEKYSMAAVIGLESKKIEEVCSKIRQEGKFVVPANYNCNVQTAVSGEESAIDKAIEELKIAGAKKVIKLNTNGPFHTEKLEKAKIEYQKELENVDFKFGNIEVIKNINGTIYTKEDNIKEILSNHIISPVRFDKAIELMRNKKIEEYVEIGPRKSFNRIYKKRRQRS